MFWLTESKARIVKKKKKASKTFALIKPTEVSFVDDNNSTTGHVF